MTKPTSAMPDPYRSLDALLAVLADAQMLKNTRRSARTREGTPESVAAHSWGLCLLVTLLEEDLDGIDVGHVLRLAVIHDLGEAIAGDVPATDQRPGDGRAARERTDLAQLLSRLPAARAAQLLALWDEYAAGETCAAQVARGLDKIETMVQHVSGRQAPDFDYLWNLGYATERTAATPLLRALRVRVDDLTKAAHAAQTT